MRAATCRRRRYRPVSSDGYGSVDAVHNLRAETAPNRAKPISSKLPNKLATHLKALREHDNILFKLLARDLKCHWQDRLRAFALGAGIGDRRLHGQSTR